MSEEVIDALHKAWVWVPDWRDGSSDNTAARIVTFQRTISVTDKLTQAVIHCTADTRYKLLVNGQRVTVGPSRSSPERWLFDAIDLAPFLRKGENQLTFIVIRYFLTTRGGMPFVRTPFPGLTVVGKVGEEDVGTTNVDKWEAVVDESVKYPYGLVDDVFLHINERAEPTPAQAKVKPVLYGFKLTNGELSPWRLSPRIIPLPEQTPIRIQTIRALQSSQDETSWQAVLRSDKPLVLAGDSRHVLDLQADVHSTAFLRFAFKSSKPTKITLKATYSEGYELEPRRYPWLRTKTDRLDAKNGQLLGPHDEVTLDVSPEGTVYEPFWFRTFRLIRLELTVGSEEVEFSSFQATQANYPLDVKAIWSEPGDQFSKDIFDISIRTMRNCMFDAYSDCPFYEQLSYSCDTRSVGLFHYLLSGDDRLIRQTITSFAGSITPEGLTQSRYPCQAPQIIPAFSLYWIMTICDHMLYFGDAKFVKPLLPLVDGVFEYFDRHIDDLGLVSGISTDMWQYVDWVNGWHESDEHPDKGVPTAGRKTNRHTYVSMVYAWVLREAAGLVKGFRPFLAKEYEARSDKLVAAIRKHCYDDKLRIFTDSTSDVPPDTPTPHSQHCQVFAVLCGAVQEDDSARLLQAAFAPDSKLGKCSYVMMFYAFRAFAKAGIYDQMYPNAWTPWRKMITEKHLTTWEEDDVRQRSDCHAWGSVPIYEYLTEVAGIKPTSSGCRSIEFSPRVGLSDAIETTVALGADNKAKVSWNKAAKGEAYKVYLKLDKPVQVVSKLGGVLKEHGEVDHLELDCQL